MRAKQYASGMKIEDAIKTAMARMIERKRFISDVVVTSWEEEYSRSGFSGCYTCGNGAEDDTYEVYINYTANGKAGYYTHEGSFAELIKELDTE